MTGKRFGPCEQSRTERQTFRPFLETLERRDVPSAAQVSAVFDQLPTDMSNLQASLSARDFNGISNNLNTVAGDFLTLKLGAAGFVPGDRLRIDNALFTDGLQLILGGFINVAFIPSQDFINLVQVGADAIRQGIGDSIITGFFPGTSGDGVLT